jgi:hypothetical protein
MLVFIDRPGEESLKKLVSQVPEDVIGFMNKRDPESHPYLSCMYRLKGHQLETEEGHPEVSAHHSSYEESLMSK